MYSGHLIIAFIHNLTTQTQLFNNTLFIFSYTMLHYINRLFHLLWNIVEMEI